LFLLASCGGGGSSGAPAQVETPVSLVSFQPDTPILSRDMNQNFQNLAGVIDSLESSVAFLDLRTLQLEVTVAELRVPRVARVEIPAGQVPPILGANDLLLDLQQHSIEAPQGTPIQIDSDITFLEQGLNRVDCHFQKMQTSSGIPDVIRVFLQERGGATLASSAAIFVAPASENGINGSDSFFANIGSQEVGVPVSVGLQHGGGISTFIDILGDATFVITYLGEVES
jgi:hypothetical protein